MQIFTSTRPWSSAKRIFLPADTEVAVLAVALGATAIVTQIVLLREFLSVFYGNELVIGILLSLWMVITGFGALAGATTRKTINPRPLSVIFVTLGVTPGLTVFFLRAIRNLIFAPGTMMDLGTICLLSSVLLFPFCFIAGFAFPLLSQLDSHRGNVNSIARIYSWEALGSVMGGVIFSVILSFFLSNFQIAAVVAAGDAILALCLARRQGQRLMMAISILLVVMAIANLTFLDLDAVTKRYLFPGQRILFSKDTPYGNVTVTEKEEQTNLYENGLLLFASQDFVSQEESVHYPMAQHPHPRHVLLISGGYAGLAEEILKYDAVIKIDYVELNPALTDVGKIFSPKLLDPRIHIVNTDARLFIREGQRNYDVVIINLPDPQTAQINRFYTDEFFREVKASLLGGSIVSLSLSSSADYMSQEAREFKGSIYATLKKNFSHVMIVAGSKDFFIASDAPLSHSIIPLIKQKGLSNRYVNDYYIDNELLARRSKIIMENLEGITKINRDFVPIAYYHSLKLWLCAFEAKQWQWTFPILFLIILLVVVRRLNAITYGIFTGGFSASAVEIIIILSFQIIYGYVYYMVGIIVSVFMAGLALGARYKPRKGKRIDHFAYVQYGIASLCLVFPLLLTHGERLISPLSFYLHLFFIGLTFFFALLIGAEFCLATHLSPGHVSHRAGKLYGFDLMGAAIGAMVISTVLIPMMGVLHVSFLLFFFNVMSGTVALWKRSNYLHS